MIEHLPDRAKAKFNLGTTKIIIIVINNLL
jgi:hypothetical protein